MMRILTFLTILLLMSFAESYAGTYSGGDGSVGTPYQISVTDDLIELSKTSADWASGKYFIQTANIVFNSDSTLVDWDGDDTLEHPGNDENQLKYCFSRFYDFNLAKSVFVFK